jgi:hypothetical protein
MSTSVDKKKLNHIRQQIQRASMGYQAQVWDNGLFEIHNVNGESDLHYIISSLNRIDEVSNISNTYRFDYGKSLMHTPPKIYTIRGNFEVPTNVKENE